MRLYKGNVTRGHAESPHALYDAELAGFGESGGLFSQQASPGFIELWSLQSRMAHRVRNEAEREGVRAMFYKALGFVIWRLADGGAAPPLRAEGQSCSPASGVVGALAAGAFLATRSSDE